MEEDGQAREFHFRISSEDLAVIQAVADFLGEDVETYIRRNALDRARKAIESLDKESLQASHKKIEHEHWLRKQQEDKFKH